MSPEQRIVNKDILEIVKAVGDEFQKLSGKTLLITGPNGLLASYLVDTIALLNGEKILENWSNNVLELLKQYDNL